MHVPFRRCFRCGWPPRAVRAWGYPHPPGVRIVREMSSERVPHSVTTRPVRRRLKSAQFGSHPARDARGVRQAA